MTAVTLRKGKRARFSPAGKCDSLGSCKFPNPFGVLIEIAEASCGGKLVFALEGGYDLEGLRDSVRAVLDELDERTHTDPLSAASTARERYVASIVQAVRRAHARSWPALGKPS